MAEGSSNAEGAPKGRVKNLVRSVSKVARNGVMIVGTVVSGGKAIDYQQHPHQVLDDSARVVRSVDKAGLDALKSISNIFPDGEKVGADQQVKVEPISENNTEHSPSIDHAIDVFYSGATEEEKKQLGIQIEVTKRYMIKNHLLTKESFERAIADETMVKELAAKYEVPDAVVESLGLGESGWNPGRKSDSDAWGVFQLTEGWAQDHDIPITGDENDGRRNTRLSAEKVAEQLHTDFVYFNGEGTANNNWSLPILAHLNGREGTKELINSWSAEHANSYSDFPTLVAELNPSAIRLFSGKYTQEEYSNEDYSGAPLYIPRIATSLALLEEYKTDGDAIFTKYGN